MKLNTTPSFLVVLAALITFAVYFENAHHSKMQTAGQVESALQNDDQVNKQYIDSLTPEQVIKIQKQMALLTATIKQWTTDQLTKSNTLAEVKNTHESNAYLKNPRFFHAYNKTSFKPKNHLTYSNLSSSTTNLKASKRYLALSPSFLETLVLNDIDATNLNLPSLDTMQIDNQILVLQNRTYKKQLNSPDTKIAQKNSFKKIKTAEEMNTLDKINLVGYWQTVHSIESKQGKLMYRPRNKSRNCTYTSGPCGHHQLTVQALKDIGCNTKQCRKDRLNYEKSLELSKKLLALNEKRLKKNGISELKDYQKYLIHQQGANGIKNILAATKGKKELSSNIKKNMANNSPYSYKQLKRMGSKLAAKKFMSHWEHKWTSEKRLIVASQVSVATDSQIVKDFIPTFDENDLLLAFNMKF